MYSVEIKTKGKTQLLHCPHDDSKTLSSGTLNLSLNSINNFNFSILPSHPLFESGIVPFLSIVTVRREREIIFRGRVVDYSLRMGSDGFMLKEYVSECELAYLIDSIQPAREIHRNAVTSPSTLITENILRNMLNHHNSRVNREKRVEFAGTDVADFRAIHTTTYESTWANIKNLVAVLGGYLVVEYSDALRLRYVQNIGKQSKMSIKLAENMQSINSDYSNGETFTRLIPLGAEVDSAPMAIQRLVEKDIISRTSFSDRNRQWWLNNYATVDPLAGSLLIELSQHNYPTELGAWPVIDLNNHTLNATFLLSVLTHFTIAVGMAGRNFDLSYWIRKASQYIEAQDFKVFPVQLQALIRRAGLSANPINPISPFGDLPKSRISIGTPNFIRVGDEDSNNIIERIEIFNTATDVATLRQYAANWLERYVITNSATIGAADLSLIDEDYEQFKIGNIYRAKNEVLGIDKSYRLVEQNINIINPAQSNLTFGAKQTALSNINNNKN